MIQLRLWTTDEIAAAVRFIKTEDPELWKAILYLESHGRDLSIDRPTFAQDGLGDVGWKMDKHLERMFPNANKLSIMSLFGQIRSIAQIEVDDQ